MIKRVIFGSLLFIVLFVGAALSFNYIHNKDRGTRPVEGYNPSMGKAYIYYDGQIINSMLGYKATLDTSLYRDSIFPVDASKTVNIVLPDSIDSGADIRYELRSFDGNNLVEDGDFRFVSTENGTTHYTATLRMDMTEGLEYSFVIKAIKGDESVNFYTRVVRLSSSRLSDFVAFAENFSDAAYSGNAASQIQASSTDAVTTYNVSGEVADIKNQQGETSTTNEVATSTDAMIGVQVADIASVFGSADAMSSMYSATAVDDITSDGNPGYVTLNSSYEDVIYDGLKIERLNDPVPKIRELTVDSAVVELRYKAISEDETGSASTYAVSEFFMLEYDNGGAKIQVHDYRRCVNQDFNEKCFDAVTNSISMGITSDRSPQFVADEKSKLIAFAADNSVWVYDNTTKTYSNAYGSSTEEAEKERSPQEGYGIHLLMVNDEMLDFVIYGRINEGPREGENGVALYEYSIKDSTLRELAFISSSLSLDAMKLSAGRFSYYDKSNRHFYALVGDKLIDVDIFSGQKNIIVEGIPSSQILVSEDQSIVAYPDTGDTTNIKKVSIINFKTGKTVEKTENGYVIAILGFVGEDIMYGVSDPEDVTKDVDGTPVFLFQKLYIVHPDGNTVKKYEKEGTLVSGILFEDNTIYLSRVSRNSETGDLSEADDDYISYKPQEDLSGIKVRIVKNEADNDIVELKLPDNVFISVKNEELFSKVTKSTNVEVDSAEAEIDQNGIYIYSPMGITGISSSAGKAIRQVSDEGGYVVDANGATLYRMRQSKPYLTVAGTFEYKSVDRDEDSFAACNYMCAISAGLPADYDEIRTINNWEESFRKYGNEVRGINISGVKMNTAIGYLSDGYPFAARIGDRYVLVVSYNDDFIRYYDPVEDQEVRLMRYLFQLKVNDKGNEFYTYYK